VFLQAYGVALAVIASSVALGQAICAAAGIRGQAWAAPMVGLSGLIIITGAAIRLPGRAITAIAIGLLFLAAAVVYLSLRRHWRLSASAVGLVIFTLFVVSIPFLASGRVGLQGVSLNNDTSAHLLWAEALRSSQMFRLWGLPSGYPLGPHSFVATLGTLLDIPLDAGFTGFLVSIGPLTALAGMGVLVGQAAWRRMLVAALCGLTFLAVAYYGEGAFKETLMAGILFAFVVHLDQVRRHWTGAGNTGWWLQLAPAIVLVAGAVYTYSYIALGWFGAAIGVWAVAELVSRPIRAYGWISRRHLLAAARALVLILVGLVVLLVPIAGQVLTFFRAHGAAPTSLPAPLGNLTGPLSTYEMFGVSLNPDFRFVVNNLHAGEVSAFAAGVVAYGFLWSLRRRDLLLPAAAGGAALLWWVASRGSSPYVAAKGLVIASPLVMAVTLKALLTAVPGQWPARLVRSAIIIAFCALAGYTSFRSLQDAPVQAPAPGRDLEAFHRTIGRSPVLFLGSDDYVSWLLGDSPVVGPNGPAAAGVGVAARPNKSPASDQAIDFDSIQPSELDRFRYVVTSNSGYNSQPYENFRLLASGRFYDLWQRTGPTLARQVLEAPGAPGVILSCRSATGRRLRLARGLASIIPRPPMVFRGRYLRPGRSARLKLHLPDGLWQLSIQYDSALNIRFSAAGRKFSIPAYLGRPGPFFAIGSVEGRGANSPLGLSVAVDRPSLFTSPFDNLATQISAIAATPLPDARQLVPLRSACGKYVDWYRPAPGSA
jgi:hypothetical protein